ncbi:unnamed protein product [Amoebophrya sp. A25]|nr:unnamed protein product [Amoebophrya sp. A25]|eukprot:GSA25T00024294001.1
MHLTNIYIWIILLWNSFVDPRDHVYHVKVCCSPKVSPCGCVQLVVEPRLLPRTQRARPSPAARSARTRKRKPLEPEVKKSWPRKPPPQRHPRTQKRRTMEKSRQTQEQL